MEMRNLIFREIIDDIEAREDIYDIKIIEQVNEKLSLLLKAYTGNRSSNIKHKGKKVSFVS